jgi:hypothetical protein
MVRRPDDWFHDLTSESPWLRSPSTCVDHRSAEIADGLSANRKLSRIDGGINPVKSASLQRLSVNAGAFLRANALQRGFAVRLGY